MFYIIIVLLLWVVFLLYKITANQVAAVKMASADATSMILLLRGIKSRLLED